MKTIYLDSDFKCHTSKMDGMKEVQTNFFDGRCDAFIEGYRLVPSGESWTRDDGFVFHGEMIAPWKDYNALYLAQCEYELAEYEALINELYAEVAAK